MELTLFGNSILSQYDETLFRLRIYFRGFGIQGRKVHRISWLNYFGMA